MGAKSKPSAVERVLDEIVNEIIRGELRPGDRLPTEPELSQKYKVGRNSVREAIKQLQAFGVLYIKRADGTFVADSYDQRMLDPLLYSLILRQHEWQDFVQLRAVIDIGTLHVALRSPEVAQVVPRLQELVDQMDEEMHRQPPSVDRVLELDLTFHTLIAGTIHNPQIDSVTDYVTRLTVPSRREVVRKKWIDRHDEDTFIDLHRQIVEVIQTRDKARIEQVIEAHYINWK